MTNPPLPPFVPSPRDDDDFVDDDTSLDDQVLDIDDEADAPLDPDLDDDLIDSAAADEIAATEGTLDPDDRL